MCYRSTIVEQQLNQRGFQLALDDGSATSNDGCDIGNPVVFTDAISLDTSTVT
jgi:hypothetical protein